MKVLIHEKLSPHKQKTPEGYLVCMDAVLARTGEQEYRRSELWGGDDDTTIKVMRKPEQVFAAETLASFENKPLTCEHPDEDVTPDNYKNYSVGFVRDVHKGVVNGEDVILGNIIVTDPDCINDIEHGVRTDLSCGYNCDITDGDHPEQINIRGNHVALCEEGRAGIARIVDSVKDTAVPEFEWATVEEMSFAKHGLQDHMYVAIGINNTTGEIFTTAADELSAAVKELLGRVRRYAQDDPDEAMKNWSWYKVKREAVKDAHPVFTEGFRTLTPDEVREILTKNKNGVSSVQLLEEYPDHLSSTILDLLERYWRGFIKLEETTTHDATNKLPKQIRNDLKQIFSVISKYAKSTDKDKDVADYIHEWERWFKIDGTPITFIREKIDGWNKMDDGMMRKDYYFSIDGYDDKFMFSVYADPETYETTERNVYFTDSTVEDTYTGDKLFAMAKSKSISPEMMQEAIDAAYNHARIHEDDIDRIEAEWNRNHDKPLYAGAKTKDAAFAPLAVANGILHKNDTEYKGFRIYTSLLGYYVMDNGQKIQCKTLDDAKAYIDNTIIPKADQMLADRAICDSLVIDRDTSDYFNKELINTLEENKDLAESVGNNENPYVNKELKKSKKKLLQLIRERIRAVEKDEERAD